MSYLLDTNVISETIRLKPDNNVIEWFRITQNSDLYLSVITLGEIRRGVEQLKDTGKKQKILAWLEQDLIQWFQGRILPISQQVADKWGFLTAQSTRSLPAIDSLIAATALTYNLKLVTRNIKDFQILSLETVNPWLED